MKQIEKQLFLATFLNDHERMKQLLGQNCEKITIPVPEHYNYFGIGQYELYPFEIALMVKDFWYDLRDSNDPVFATSNSSEKKQNASRIQNLTTRLIYHQTLQTLEIIKSFQNVALEVDYSRMINLINTYDVSDPNDRYFDQEEIVEYMKQGWRRIDIELINAADMRDKKMVIELLKAGANPFICIESPDCFYQSEALEHLSTEDSFYGTQLSSYWKTEPSAVLSDEENYRILELLYGAASSADLFRTIIKNSKVEPPPKAIEDLRKREKSFTEDTSCQ